MPEGSCTVRELLNSILFYRRAALILGLTVFLIGILVAVLMPPSYTARARLLTLNASVYDMQPGTTGSAPVQDPTAAVNTEMQLLASPELHRSVVRGMLGPNATPGLVNQQSRQFEAHFHVSKVEAANVIELEFTDSDPERAASALRRLLAGYFEERANVLTSGRVGFLNSQLEKVRASLDEANSEIAAYERQNDIVDVNAQVGGAVDFANQLQLQQQQADAAVAESQDNVLVLLRNALNVPKEIEIFSDNTEAAHAVGTMEVSLFQLEAKRADLASRYMPGSPFIAQVDAQIADLKVAIAAQKKELNTASRTGHNTDYDTVQDRLIQAEANLKGQKARLAILNGQVAASKNHLKSLIAVSDTLDRLRMQRDLLADTVKNYSTQLEQARIQQNQATTTGSTNVRVIEAPVPPSRRNNPPLLMVAASLFSAVLISGVGVFTLSSLRETFLSPHEAELALALPVLCDLPRQGVQRNHFGRLIATITSAPATQPGKVILLLSPRSETSLEQVSHALANALAHREPQKVALILLREMPLGVFDEKTMPIRPIDGVATMTVDVALSRERLTALLRELRSVYTYTVVQPPPTAVSFEGVECSAVSDFVFLIVEAEQTRKPVAQAILAQVNQLGAQVQGLIMTGRKMYIPNWAYSFADRRDAA